VEDLEKIELDVIFENPKAIDKILKFRNCSGIKKIEDNF
jgi:hypothetical protein